MTTDISKTEKTLISLQDWSNKQIDQLWSSLPHPSNEHVVRLFARGKGGKLVGDYARSPKEVSRFLWACDEMSVYIAPNPTKKADGIRHSADDVTHWSYFFFDVDPIEDNADPIAATEEFLKAFGGYVGRNLIEKEVPTIINSGRGVQVWFRGEDIEFTDDSIPRKNVRKIMSYWLNKVDKRVGISHGCRLDMSVSDLPRVMRLPGSINLKTGRSSEIVTLQKKPFPWLFFFLVGATPNEVTAEIEYTDVPVDLKWDDYRVFHRLTPTAKAYLQFGKEEPGRHKAIWHVAKSLRELGVSREEARRAIRWGNKLKGQNEELPSEAIEHALNTAYFA